MAWRIDKNRQVRTLGELASMLEHGADRRGQPPDL